MKIIQIFFVPILNTLSYSQINIWPISQVSDSFKQQYFSKKRDYNPLQVGNLWQYYNNEYHIYLTSEIIKDSLINGKTYYKKINYQITPTSTNLVSWERNDTTSGISFMLDFEDVNLNGDSLDELPIDSLENPFWSRYISYKYSFKQPNPFSFFPGPKTVLIKDTNWVKIENDTVISRKFEILEAFWSEMLIEKFGIFSFMLESPISYCNGAIINGRQYGTIVNINNFDTVLPVEFILYNNFPNPFNLSTTIIYSLPFESEVSITIFDLTGRVIKTMNLNNQAAGNKTVMWDGKNDFSKPVSSGAYICTFKALSLEGNGKSFTKSLKLMLLK